MRASLLAGGLAATSAFSACPAFAGDEDAAAIVSEGGFAAIRVASVPRSIAWYREVFDFREIAASADGSFALIERDGLLLELQMAPLAPAAPDAPLRAGAYKIGLLVADLDPVIGRLKARDVALLGEVIVSDAGGRRMLAIADPDGTIIQIFGK